ncbi:hypothetical protein BC940DRAFT_303211 [Gongronella butleri]|nr:hypothetical protein BC940DRAFT_303211 [Gongronella butleri]
MSVQATLAFLNGHSTAAGADGSTNGSNTSNSTNATTPPPMLPLQKNKDAWRRQPRTTTDMHVEELEQMYQSALDQHEADQKLISKLQSDVEAFECDETKVRDFEIRVEYLAQKLEQVSEERDAFERELLELKKRVAAVPPPSSIATPLSPEFNPEDYLLHPTGEDEHGNDVPPEEMALNHNPAEENQHYDADAAAHDDDVYIDDILDAYENDNAHHEEEHQEQQLLQEIEQGMKMAMQQYVLDLERQRLQNRQLQSVIDKQDKLIRALEGDSPVEAAAVPENKEQGIKSEEAALLRQQVELQRIELESKRDLLTQLLNEREDLLKKVHRDSSNQQVDDSTSQQQQHPLYRHNSNRSSIDILAELAQLEAEMPVAPMASNPMERNTPTPPPRTPLPPVPTTNTTGDPSPSFSYSHPSSASSPVSWSSSSHEHPKNTPKTNDTYAVHPLSHDTQLHTAAASPPKSFWKAYKN